MPQVIRKLEDISIESQQAVNRLGLKIPNVYKLTAKYIGQEIMYEILAESIYEGARTADDPDSCALGCVAILLALLAIVLLFLGMFCLMTAPAVGGAMWFWSFACLAGDLLISIKIDSKLKKKNIELREAKTTELMSTAIQERNKRLGQLHGRGVRVAGATRDLASTAMLASVLGDKEEANADDLSAAVQGNVTLTQSQFQRLLGLVTAGQAREPAVDDGRAVYQDAVLDDDAAPLIFP
jgi:hypothetical protein